MERKLGLYVTLGNDGSLKRTLVSISGETELEATTLNDEVILFSELIFDFYAFIVDRIRLSAAYLVTQDGDGKDIRQAHWLSGGGGRTRSHSRHPHGDGR